MTARPLTDDRRALAERFAPAAHGVAARAAHRFPRLADELSSETAWGLVRAAGTYDKRRRARFSTLLYKRLRGAVRDVLKRQPRNPPQRLGGVLSTAPPVGHDLETREEAEALLRRLPRDEACVLWLIYLYGKTQTQAGAILNLCQARVSRLHRTGLAMLREQMETSR